MVLTTRVMEKHELHYWQLSLTASRSCHGFVKSLISPKSLLSGCCVMIILPPCRSMNFIAGSARKIARFLSAPATGKGQNARIAVRRSCPRSFLRSPRPRRVRPIKLRRAVACRVPAACAALANRTGIELWPSPATAMHNKQLLPVSQTTLAMSRCCA